MDFSGPESEKSGIPNSLPGKMLQQEPAPHTSATLPTTNPTYPYSTTTPDSTFPTIRLDKTFADNTNPNPNFPTITPSSTFHVTSPTSTSPRRYPTTTSFVSSPNDVLLRVVTFPYYRSFQRNTQQAVAEIIQERDADNLEKLLRTWIRTKVRESQYVQVASAVLLSSICSCLQWPALGTTHWTGAALFYAGLVFSVIAIVLGAQQTMILPDMQDKIDARALQHKMTARHNSELKARRGLIFALQCPMMFLSFSLITFAGGICAVVISPFGRNPKWNSDAKIMLIFFIATLMGLLGFTSCSAFIHQGFEV